MRRTQTDQRGFTLVELMVVILIIGILIAIAIAVFTAAQSTAERRACLASQRELEGAYQTYLASGGLASAAPDWGGLMTAIVPDYISTEPACPGGGTYTWSRPNVTCSIPTHN